MVSQQKILYYNKVRAQFVINLTEIFSAVVPENVPIGISVINITATDPDEGIGGEIKYDFLDEGEANG